MPTIPNTRSLNANSVDILNAIRNSATTNYREYVPIATNSPESVREIGAVIMDYPALQNEFLNALVNRIGRVILTSKMYTNPWAAFKKGLLEFGEVVEEVFVSLALPSNYDPATAENKVFARKIPDVKSAFHVLNYQKFYKATIQNRQLRQAFLSWTGITDLIAKIVDSMYSAAYYDEFQVMKYLLARHILDGQLYAEEIPEATAANAKAIVASVKSMSNSLEFMSTKYNLAGVPTFSKKENQYIIVNSKFDAIMDVEVLATAFNMNKAEFMGHRVLVDGFGELDNDRLAVLFEYDSSTETSGDGSGYKPLSSAEKAALNSVPAVLVDETFFMIFDNLFEFTEQYNGEGLYWNYWYHVWKTFSVSPFANSIVFVGATPAITSVTLDDDSITASAGQSVQLSVDVVATNFADKSVNWTISGYTLDGSTHVPIENLDASVSPNGLVSLGSTLTVGDYIEVTATSVYDSTKSDTATITIA